MTTLRRILQLSKQEVPGGEDDGLAEDVGGDTDDSSNDSDGSDGNMEGGINGSTTKHKTKRRRLDGGQDQELVGLVPRSRTAKVQRIGWGEAGPNLPRNAKVAPNGNANINTKPTTAVAIAAPASGILSSRGIKQEPSAAAANAEEHDERTSKRPRLANPEANPPMTQGNAAVSIAVSKAHLQGSATTTTTTTTASDDSTAAGSHTAGASKAVAVSEQSTSGALSNSSAVLPAPSTVAAPATKNVETASPDARSVTLSRSMDDSSGSTGNQVRGADGTASNIQLSSVKAVGEKASKAVKAEGHDAAMTVAMHSNPRPPPRNASKKCPGRQDGQPDRKEKKRKRKRAAAAAAAAALAAGTSGAGAGTASSATDAVSSPRPVVNTSAAVLGTPTKPESVSASCASPASQPAVDWVQCDRCRKWRTAPPQLEVNKSLVDSDWFCEMNTWDPDQANCDAEEPESAQVGAANSPAATTKSNTNTSDLKVAANGRQAGAGGGGNTAKAASARDKLNAGKDVAGNKKERKAALLAAKKERKHAAAAGAADTSARGASAKGGDGSSATDGKSRHKGSGGSVRDGEVGGGGGGIKVKRGSNKRTSQTDKNSKNAGEGASTSNAGGGAATGGGTNSNVASAKDTREWVQCDTCEQWRGLPLEVDVASLPETWYCHMNIWDPARASCSAAQEVYQTPGTSAGEASGADGGFGLGASGAGGGNANNAGGSGVGFGKYREMIQTHFKHSYRAWDTVANAVNNSRYMETSLFVPRRASRRNRKRKFLSQPSTLFNLLLKDSLWSALTNEHEQQRVENGDDVDDDDDVDGDDVDRVGATDNNGNNTNAGSGGAGSNGTEAPTVSLNAAERLALVEQACTPTGVDGKGAGVGLLRLTKPWKKVGMKWTNGETFLCQKDGI